MAKQLKRIAKISFVLALIIGIMLIVLGNIGGQNSEFKASIEGYITESTGYPARISVLNNIRFFPNIVINFNDLRVFKTEEKTQTVARLGYMHTVMSFWDVLGQTGRFKFISVKDLNIDAGLILKQDITLSALDIQQENESVFYLKGHGKIGDYPFNIELPLKTRGSGYNITFSFSGERPFLLNIGDVRFEGLAQKGIQSFEIKELNISLEEKNLIENGFLEINTDSFVFKHNSESQGVENAFDYLAKIFILNDGHSPFQRNVQGQMTLFERPITFEN